MNVVEFKEIVLGISREKKDSNGDNEHYFLLTIKGKPQIAIVDKFLSWCIDDDYKEVTVVILDYHGAREFQGRKFVGESRIVGSEKQIMNLISELGMVLPMLNSKEEEKNT